MDSLRPLHISHISYENFSRNSLLLNEQNFLTVHWPLKKHLNAIKKQSLAELKNILIAGRQGSGRAWLARQLCHERRQVNGGFIFLRDEEILRCKDLNHLILPNHQGIDIYIEDISSKTMKYITDLYQQLQKSNVRIIASIQDKGTNLKMNSDIFHHFIEIPPLRKRKEDIELIINSMEKFLGNIGLSKNAKHFLNSYSWPGEVKQLIDVIQMCYSFKKKSSTIICCRTLEKFIESSQAYNFDMEKISNNFSFYIHYRRNGLKQTLIELERYMIAKTLDECDGSVTLAARMLQIPNSSLDSKIKKLGNH